jgi:hypothetical protein
MAHDDDDGFAVLIGKARKDKRYQEMGGKSRDDGDDGDGDGDEYSDDPRECLSRAFDAIVSKDEKAFVAEMMKLLK